MEGTFSNLLGKTRVVFEWPVETIIDNELPNPHEQIDGRLHPAVFKEGRPSYILEL